MRTKIKFAIDFASYALKGDIKYYSWLLVLSFFALVGLFGIYEQFTKGLIVTGMTDQIPWGLYESNFIFLVGVAAAAVTIVFPSYIYHHKHLKSIVVLGEMLAIAAVTMVIMFIFLHMGRPDRFWHMFPIIGIFNFPGSMLQWDALVLNGYLGLNVICAFYYLYKKYTGQPLNEKFYMTLIYISIVWALSIHTVTAFLMNTMPARPMWFHTMVPIKFITTAFSGGAAFMIVVFLIIRNGTALKIADEAIELLSKTVVWCLGIALFLTMSEIVTELYHGTEHAYSLKYLMFGRHGLSKLVAWFWISLLLNVTAFLLLLNLNFRRDYKKLRIACIMVFVGIWIEKGLGFVVPGFIPTPIGEFAEYSPTLIEIMNSVGVWAIGLLLYTLLAKGSIGVLLSEVKHPSAVGKEAEQH